MIWDSLYVSGQKFFYGHMIFLLNLINLLITTGSKENLIRIIHPFAFVKFCLDVWGNFSTSPFIETFLFIRYWGKYEQYFPQVLKCFWLQLGPINFRSIFSEPVEIVWELLFKQKLREITR